jgi:hypothetical protein
VRKRLCSEILILTRLQRRISKDRRTQTRGMTRLTSAFSKKWANHQASMILYAAHCNSCRVHSSIRVTPAMEAGITDHIWSLRDLLAC